ncbi:MAG: imidazolonepropionase [Actinomycetota bacterium]
MPVPAVTPVEPVSDGVLAWEGDSVTFAGPRSGWDGPIDEELAGRTVIPGFVDCHTHLPFYGWRDDEFEARLAGVSYAEQHGEGGIPRSARMLAEASDDQVMEFCAPLLGEMAAHGTTALELKTGYGLSVEAELRQARLARRLAEEAPQTATVTLLAGHAVPEGMTAEAWLRLACEELIPAAARENLCDAVDIYVEDIAFTNEDLERVAAVAAKHGLPIRCHAEQLSWTGSAEIAAALGARSADHLNHLSPGGAKALGSSSTCAGLLPASTLMLGSQRPPVAALRSAGAALTLATDLNPGTSAVQSMPEAIAIGCSLYRLAPREALVASTINAAWVLGLHERHGWLGPGSRADFAILEGPDIRMVPYRPGHNPVVATFIGGEAVTESSR